MLLQVPKKLVSDGQCGCGFSSTRWTIKEHVWALTRQDNPKQFIIVLDLGFENKTTKITQKK